MPPVGACCPARLDGPSFPPTVRVPDHHAARCGAMVIDDDNDVLTAVAQIPRVLPVIILLHLLCSLYTSHCAHVTDSLVVLRCQIYDNFLNGMNPQDNSDGMTISDNHVSDAAVMRRPRGCSAGGQETRNEPPISKRKTLHDCICVDKVSVVRCFRPRAHRISIRL